MPVPDGPVLFVGEGGEGFAGVDDVCVADGAKEMAIEEGIAVGVRFAQVEARMLCERVHGAGFCLFGDGFAVDMAGPPAAFFGELRGADPRLNAQTAGFEFAFESGGGQTSERLKRPGKEHDFVLLLDVPGDAGQAFFEKGNRIEVSVQKRRVDVGEVTLVGVLDGDEAVREKAESLDTPAKVIDDGNFAAVAQFAEEAAFERWFGQKSAVEVENSGDAVAGFDGLGSQEERIR